MVGGRCVPRLPAVLTDAVLDVSRFLSLVLNVHTDSLRCQWLIRPYTKAAIRLAQTCHALFLWYDSNQRAPLARFRRLWSVKSDFYGICHCSKIKKLLFVNRGITRNPYYILTIAYPLNLIYQGFTLTFWEISVPTKG